MGNSRVSRPLSYSSASEYVRWIVITPSLLSEVESHSSSSFVLFTCSR